jgi:cytochrome c5
VFGAALLVLLAACTEAPAGAVAGGGAAAGAEPAGKAIYETYCYGCHAFGAAGAPKFGDRALWAPRIARGEDALVAAALAGVPPGMPPKGGMCIQCSEADIRAAVAYMVDAVE